MVSIVEALHSMLGFGTFIVTLLGFGTFIVTLLGLVITIV
ncbi:MAG: putative holin-like toxin, partial [Staphylococcus equorum]